MLANYRVETGKWPDVLDWNDLENTVIKRCAIKVCCVRLVESSVLMIEQSISSKRSELVKSLKIKLKI